jgi:hypothetical protein
MKDDYASAIVAWVASATRRQEAPMLRERTEGRILQSELRMAIGPIIDQAAAPAEFSEQLTACFPADRSRLDLSLPVVEGLRAAIAGQLASAVRADPVAWRRADGAADPSWPAAQLTSGIFTAMRQATMESVVSYLQARGFVTLTFGYYAPPTARYGRETAAARRSCVRS